MVKPTRETLLSAIERNASAVLSLPSGGMMRTHKSRFLRAEPEGFWMETPAESSGLIVELIGSGIPVDVSFKAENLNVVFNSQLLGHEAAYRLNDDVSVSAACVKFPDELRLVQRRNVYRVNVPTDASISARIWVIPEHWILRDKPSATAELKVALRDLCATGMGVVVHPRDGKPPQFAQEQRLRIGLKLDDEEIILDARVKHVLPNPDRSVRVGIQFKKLESDVEGRRTLTRLNAVIAQMQRDEVKRSRQLSA
jgi:c-di-GMP-binding flagellar brake protein YcgR